jgi:AcrR family transcriptional regulator
VSPSTPRPKAAGASLPPASLPALPRPPRPATRREPPRRRTAITAEAIVSAAIEVLDEAGVEGLTMRRVAERIGTGPASLYAHVSSKEELLELVFDELVGQVPLPEPDAAHWREQVIEILTGFRAVLLGHRDAALAGLGRVPTSPKVLAAMEVLTTIMQLGGLSDYVIALGIDQLTLYVSAGVVEDGVFSRSGMTAHDIEQYYEQIHDYYMALPAALYPTLVRVAADMTDHDGDERFRFGLEALLAGYEALSARS